MSSISPGRDGDLFEGEKSLCPYANKHRTKLRRLETAALIAARHMRPNRSRVHIDHIELTHNGCTAYFSCGGNSDERGKVEITAKLYEQLCGNPV